MMRKFGSIIPTRKYTGVASERGKKKKETVRKRRNKHECTASRKPKPRNLRNKKKKENKKRKKGEKIVYLHAQIPLIYKYINTQIYIFIFTRNNSNHAIRVKKKCVKRLGNSTEGRKRRRERR
ncbi:hypothetical protein, unlikely [Trypanosoma brucei brucei TREU927]|uniref:Uncharacterized protein n=1 Tax=Trypanosoma brucei brucei (strain 927/4 GUTat10.1) TaxID=185431 RepID=Q38DS3_TRYB2|nr:hypothetical protein, unlikely [Trypanosoma brucei brucei TREU927]EAN77047.1 hypothetical protein, unlikely [Trypanosoma brucei brucei TREU927]